VPVQTPIRTPASHGLSPLANWRNWVSRKIEPGLAGAVWGRGHALLLEALEAVPESDDALGDLLARGHAYRRRALASPRLYGVMFGDSLGEMEPDERALAAAAGSFGALVDSVARCQRDGRIRAGDPTQIARIVFASCHGAASLELTGRAPEDLDLDLTYEQILGTLLAGLAPGAAPG
jgi:AcrR family transcriptional regulator